MAERIKEAGTQPGIEEFSKLNMSSTVLCLLVNIHRHSLFPVADSFSSSAKFKVKNLPVMRPSLSKRSPAYPEIWAPRLWPMTWKDAGFAPVVF